ncbi:UNVERIFIED_CONTAM: hypothetical protein GTU68_012565 [Idotea baltica]|nr:hypothetical protein [Idotea baltica]
MDALKPKKHLGQHFLADENTARKIVSLLNVPEGAPVVEIGPGMGVLTKYLVEKYKEVHVVEYDPDAVAYLKSEFAGTGLIIHHADVLKWSLPDHLKQPAYFIGNLPYNVSSPIFFLLLENKKWVKQGVFMVQKEVADRVCAPESAGAKQKGILSVLVSRYFKAKNAFKVKPSVFRPPPKVMSGVFTMDRLEGNDEPEFSVLKKVVKAAFGKRRKTLRNALKELEVDWSQFPETWPQLRAEALPFDAFNQIAASLNSIDHES